MDVARFGTDQTVVVTCIGDVMTEIERNRLEDTIATTGRRRPSWPTRPTLRW